MTNRRMPWRQGVALVLAFSGCITAGSSWAQTTTSQPTLSEIVVTAQKREQNIQDVPISVIALSAQQLKDAGVTDIKDMQVLTPGLTVTSTTNESSTTARIRGIGTVGDNPGLESSVGVVIDGVYRPRNGVGFGNLGEIEQIEVLEGPQGELFGKNNDAAAFDDVWGDGRDHRREFRRSRGLGVGHGTDWLDLGRSALRGLPEKGWLDECRYRRRPQHQRQGQ